MKLQTLKGFRDFLPQQAKKRQYVINTLKKVFELYGFEPLETPALEYEEVLLGKYGEEGDKLMYRFTDLGKRKVAMRYDLTVPLARVAAQYQNIPIPFKRYQIKSVWRAENPQKGRYREFLQCDIDTLGVDGIYADYEIISCAIAAAKKLGFKNIKMLINDRLLFKNLESTFVSAIDKLAKIGKEGVVSELVRKGMKKNDAQKLINSFDRSEPTSMINSLFKLLKETGLKENEDFSFEPTLARGLDYYTGAIFELVCEDYPSGSIGGGGRYDKLIGQFANRDIPAVGFSFGFDRLLEAMELLKLLPNDLVTTRVLVTIFSPDFTNTSLDVVSKLRNNGISAEINLDPELKLDKQLKYADRKRIPYVVIIGPAEVKRNVILLKNMRTGKQEEVKKDQLAKKLKVS
ncbi:histidine--tRNA ligase [Candidatus Roizmanbacteria bacterium]|nr:histidine--tRNA ligase [Candidatus Roizmanbacteria bacterium]